MDPQNPKPEIAPVTRAELEQLVSRVNAIDSRLEPLPEQVRQLEQHRIDAPAQIIDELHQKVFAAVDARPPAPRLYKIDPEFLDRFDKLERRAAEENTGSISAVVDEALRPALERLNAIDTNLRRVLEERLGQVREGLSQELRDRLFKFSEWVRETVEGAKPPPAFEPVERATSQTPATPEEVKAFREQLATRALPELGELEAYEPELPELKPLQEIGKIDDAGDGKPEAEHIEGATLKPELATEPQQDGPPSTQKEPAETASGEPPQNT